MKRITVIILVLALALGLCACTSRGSNRTTDVNGWLVFAAIVGLVVQFCFAVVFGGIAKDKGYSQTSYFWVCFLFGVAGYCLVAALPDKVLQNNVKEKRNGMAPNVQEKDGWTCSCGRKNANYVSTCICGVNKHECQ